MSKNNYFQIGEFELQYPIHLILNRKKWNFKSEYERRVNKLLSEPKTCFDFALDLGFFEDIVIYRFIPFIVTDDIRVGKDKRTYYLVDYFLPEYNLVIINHKDNSSSRHLKQTMMNLGYDVIELIDFNILKYSAKLTYLNGIKTSLNFRTKPEQLILPKYFE